ncbi:SMC-Scp complex subunit ScpB [Danxiaibacter flavus]|uniref:SMC-Scp complex subunit ScpB n=1 Tax=Danxiaibacter flavus TaxID=3049108 RepID=A0ABV3ZDD9_9BACT|nr:SMC-Scp complex subunit ScpB [Chitinophagaceae bacterium DXS]
MELSEIIPHIEALIFASEKPLTSMDIVELINNAFGFMEERIMLDQVESCIEGIREKYNAEFYPFEVRESGGGWQFLTKKDFYKTVGQLNGDKFLKRLSTAALETLAIVAYKQPITKGEIEAIRGVNSDYSVQKLLEKELIVITGRNELLPGKPLVYSTSKSFMDYFGINSTADLPKINEILAEQLIEPTLVRDGQLGENLPEIAEGENEEAPLAVDSNGDLIEHAETNEEQGENDITAQVEQEENRASVDEEFAAELDEEIQEDEADEDVTGDESEEEAFEEFEEDDELEEQGELDEEDELDENNNEFDEEDESVEEDELADEEAFEGVDEDDDLSEEEEEEDDTKHNSKQDDEQSSEADNEQEDDEEDPETKK